MPSPRLTPAQRKELLLIHEHGFSFFPSRSPRGLTRYKPLWALVDMGLLTWGFGPKGSFLKTYCFMPAWTDPIC